MGFLLHFSGFLLWSTITQKLHFWTLWVRNIQHKSQNFYPETKNNCTFTLISLFDKKLWRSELNAQRILSVKMSPTNCEKNPKKIQNFNKFQKVEILSVCILQITWTTDCCVWIVIFLQEHSHIHRDVNLNGTIAPTNMSGIPKARRTCTEFPLQIYGVTHPAVEYLP